MTNSATAELQLDANDSDVELMLRSKAGDDAAFSELFERYAKRLVGFAYRMVRDRWRAEELVQDAFLQIYRARERYSPSARFSTYIYRVVTNNCLNEIRRLGHEKTAPGRCLIGKRSGFSRRRPDSQQCESSRIKWVEA
jgi:RNA polymerase sigma factor (sigma-70 family)